MTRTCRCVWPVLVLGLLVPALARAQVPDAEKVPVTNPDELASMGFPRDAANVYRWARIASVGGSPTSVADAEAALAPRDFGTSKVDFTALSPKAFDGRESVAAGAWLYSGGSNLMHLSRLGTEPFADAQLSMPTGVNLQFIRVWGNDTDAGANMALFVFEVCQPDFTAGATTITQIVNMDPFTIGATGDQTNLAGLPAGFTVNNRGCHYVARVRFDATGTGLQLQKVRAHWVRQVSPAPAAASFADVPTTHPFFRFVEALVAAGITGGCGGGNYCPDSAVTRGQMAVFLSTALGLSFP